MLFFVYSLSYLYKVYLLVVDFDTLLATFFYLVLHKQVAFAT